MQICQAISQGRTRKGAIAEKGRHRRHMPRRKGVTEVSGSGRPGDDVVERVVGDESFGEELSRQHVEMVADGLDMRLMAQMLHGSGGMGTSCDTQTLHCGLEKTRIET